MAAGCYVQTSEKEVLNDLSVDIVIGNDRKHDLVRLLEEYSLDSVNDTVDDINDGKHDFVGALYRPDKGAHESLHQGAGRL